ncbi:MAG: hypothetical protein D6722_07465 [Bacteroidetes bacterium]|nr:MAG: hypothetical protein D6722_07465 [Bacteroidota bacterium]
MEDARDQALKVLRPHVGHAETKSEIEAFQHAVLRPLLKLQHDLLVLQFEDQARSLKLPWDRMPAAERRATAEHLMQTHHRLRASLTGLVTGLMTREEFGFFLLHQDELGKRLSSMLMARLQSAYPDS